MDVLPILVSELIGTWFGLGLVGLVTKKGLGEGLNNLLAIANKIKVELALNKLILFPLLHFPGPPTLRYYTSRSRQLHTPETGVRLVRPRDGCEGSREK